MITKEVYRYCSEDISLIENYKDAISDKTNVWNIHHKLELEDEYGNARNTPLSMKDLIYRSLYYHRPARELIFVTRKEHLRLHRRFIQNEKWHQSFKRTASSEEYKQKQHDMQSKLIYWNNGEVNERSEICPGEGWVRGRLSYGEEYKKQRSIKQKEVGSRKEFKENHSRKMKGRHWFNNGEKELNAKECPEGFVPGRLPKLEETCKKISKSRKGIKCKNKGKRWFNNGNIETLSKTCPEGFVPGRLRK